MSEIEADVREIFRTIKSNEVRIGAIASYITEAIDHEGPVLCETGIPGLAVDFEEAPGVRIGRNCNGSIVEVEITP